MKRTKPKVKEKKTEKDNFDYMKTNKDNINNIIKDPTILPIINDLVNRTNKIVIHAYQFIKLYCIYHYDNNIPFPLIDKNFICDVFKVLTIRKCNTGGYTKENMPHQLKGLLHFYKTHYFKTISHNETIFYDKLSYILAYEAIDMTTNINNNIQKHFIDHLNKYVNIVFEVKEKSTQITKDNKDKIIRKQLHKNLYDEICKVKKDLMSFSDLTSDQKYHQWIIQERIKLYLNKTRFDNDNIYYDLKSNTQDYLISMFHISNELEKLNQVRIQNDEKQIRLFYI